MGVTVECPLQSKLRFQYARMARPEGFEPPTYGFEVLSNSDRDII